MNNYNGSASITDPDIKALNNDYFTKNYSSSYYNMKAVAYMLDTNAWSVYAGEKAEYAIGGPSIEMLMKSYSGKYGVNYKAQANTKRGYEISNNGGSLWGDYCSDMLSTSDRTYVISPTNKAYGYWLASPSDTAADYVMEVRFSGDVNAGSCIDSKDSGFRPLVCLKSDTKLEKNADGSFTIVERPKNNNINPTTDYGAIVKGYESEYSDVVGWRIFYADYEHVYAIVKGYESEYSDVVGWRIFYADYEHVYLIADDYIPYENIPANSVGHKPDKGEYARSAYFTSILNDYTGSASITNADIKALNNDYFTKGYSSTYNNMKSAAYMLDTNTWSVYAGEDAEYAIGGPSIEQIMTSYSEKYGVDYKTQASNSTGYQIRKNGGSSWTNSIASMLSTSDKTYVINSTDNSWGMWLSSPSAANNNSMMRIRSSGDVGNYSCSDKASGFRPLVCLKSDVTLQKNSDGSYTIT